MARVARAGFARGRMMRKNTCSRVQPSIMAASSSSTGSERKNCRIILPLAKPALATLAIFTLLGSWNDLVWPLIAINNDHAFTLQLGLANFQGTRRTQWSLLMAGNVVATLPLILFFLFAQKQFIATMTFSGLKG